MEKRVLLVGTSSGGHVFPLVAVARALKAQAQRSGIALNIRMLGDDNRGFLARASKEAQIPAQNIYAGKLPRFFTFSFLWELIKIPIGILQSFWHVFMYMPDVVFAKGGYDSLGPVLAARFYFIPVYLHESDTIPGLANRLLARMSRGVFTAFPSTEKFFKEKALHVGNPVRPELFVEDRQQALTSFSFSSERKTLLILGGSQGAKQINGIITTALVELVGDYQIIHQSGDTQYMVVRATVDEFIKEGRDTYGKLLQERYKLFPFLEQKELAMAYAAADIVIARAGSGLIFEIAQLGKPAIIIPLPGSANDHQLTNAIEFSATGIPVVEGANITTHILTSQIHGLLQQDTANPIKQKLKAFATPQAADTIAATLLKIL